jgi:D-sedoheptulose 7-phosphate isomerase
MSEASFAATYLAEAQAVLGAISHEDVERVAAGIAEVRSRGGRLFVIGVGGSAATASHCVNDFRKLCDLECYAPTDNVSELTARTNDEGWESVFAQWLATSRLSERDGVLVLSVGGGDRDRGVSANLVAAIELARARGASVLGIVGRDGGFTQGHSTACVIVPPLYAERITPHTEAICSVICHLLVSHPSLQRQATRWEELEGPR